MTGDYPRFKTTYTHEDLVEHFLLSPADHAVIDTCYGDANRHGSVASFHWSQLRVCSLAVTSGALRGSETMAVRFKGAHCPQDIILMGVRWSVAYP